MTRPYAQRTRGDPAATCSLLVRLNPLWRCRVVPKPLGSTSSAAARRRRVSSTCMRWMPHRMASSCRAVICRPTSHLRARRVAAQPGAPPATRDGAPPPVLLRARKVERQQQRAARQ
eukprot:scaffold3662_cov388-Prasinococcus_capsulatus_cf.AAC.2